MDEQIVNIPPHLVMLGEEARRLTEMLDRDMARKIVASRQICWFGRYLSKRLDRLASLIASTAK